MKHHVVLDVRVVADHDPVDVAPKHGVVPDTGIIAQGDVAQHNRAPGDIDRFAQRRPSAQKFVELFVEFVQRGLTIASARKENKKAAGGSVWWGERPREPLNLPFFRSHSFRQINLSFIRTDAALECPVTYDEADITTVANRPPAPAPVV
jgi:hypothetical protein